jgi:hypothetical protein
MALLLLSCLCCPLTPLLLQVYRMATADIGCSLAEAAESAEYLRYLQEAAHTPNSLHVVYINTSLRTKATAHSLVPTITCTSSNVVQTVLQGFAQVRGCRRWPWEGVDQPASKLPSCSIDLFLHSHNHQGLGLGQHIERKTVVEVTAP